jgi:hypothetical protein
LRTGGAVDARIKVVKKELNDRLALISQAERKNRKPALPLPLDRALAYLGDIRNTLNQEIPRAAEVIRNLVGRIAMQQEKDAA